jgi:ParB-like chromosome segregation protein Spo0J
MKVKISEIKPNPNNPRIIKDDKFKKLVESIKSFPEMLEIRPIVVNRHKTEVYGIPRRW